MLAKLILAYASLVISCYLCDALKEHIAAVAVLKKH